MHVWVYKCTEKDLERHMPNTYYKIWMQFLKQKQHDKENLVKKQMAPQMNYHHPVSVNI